MKAILKRILFGSDATPRKVHFGLLGGRRFVIDPKYQSQRLFSINEWEIRSILKLYTRRAKTAIDVGANDGWYTVFFSTSQGVTTVLACEPNQNFSSMLQRNLQLNQSKINAEVNIVPKLVGLTKGTDFVTLDTLIAETAGPHLIKIDVDGAELDVLRSGEQSLRKESSLLVVETHSAELERDCIEFLEGLDYECTIVKNGWYRRFVPEHRPIAHNRWFTAQKS